MLSVAVQKDVTEYKPKIVGQLTLRTLVCSVAAIGVSVLIGCWFGFILGLSFDVAMIAIIVFSVPLWAMGFVSPYGLPFEQFVPMWFKHRFGNNLVKYRPTFMCNDDFKYLNGPQRKAEEFKKKNGSRVSKNYQILCKRPDFEAYNPTKAFEERTAQEK